MIAHQVMAGEPRSLGCTPQQRHDVLAQYLAVLTRADWARTIRDGFDPSNGYHVSVANRVAMNLPLPEFPTPEVDHGG